MTDPLNDALREATLTVLLGSNVVPHTYFDGQGNPVMGITTVESAFAQRIRARAQKGDFDSIIDQAAKALTPDHLTDLLGEALVAQMLQGLEPIKNGYNQAPTPGWLALQARKVAVEAATAALMADEALLETLRQRIGMEVDRNRVGISVQLSDPESAKP